MFSGMLLVNESNTENRHPCHRSLWGTNACHRQRLPCHSPRPTNPPEGGPPSPFLSRNTPVLSQSVASAILPQACPLPGPQCCCHRRKERGGAGKGGARKSLRHVLLSAVPSAYLSKQWAAVSTHSGEIKVPPQKCFRNLGGKDAHGQFTPDC